MTAYDYFVQRGVKRLCHFTSLKNLSHILYSSDGILPSSVIRGDMKTVNDPHRYDGCPDFVCCSVQYPNCWYMEKAMKENNDKDTLFKDWAVIFIDLEILNQTEIKYCPVNAASGYGRFIRDKFDTLFHDSVSNDRRTIVRKPNMLSCCPTDDQAEVLIKGGIPRSYISGIAVATEMEGAQIKGIFPTIKIDPIPLYLAPVLFTKEISSMVRLGQIPEETPI